MTINCPKCHQVVDAANINTSTLLALCEHCDEMFNVSLPVGGSGATAARILTPTPTLPLKLPLRTLPGITLTQQGGSLVITRSNPARNAQLALFVFIVSVFILFAVFFNHIGVHSSSQTNNSGLVLAAPLIIIICYFLLTKVANSTVIRVSNAMLTVRIGPLPAGGNKDVQVQDIDQLFCDKQIHRSRDGSNAIYTLIYYDVIVQLKSGQRVTLVFALENYEDAHYIERQIESFLDITDRTMAGETSGV